MKELLERVRYAAERILCKSGESLQMCTREEWFNSILPSGEPTRLDSPRPPFIHAAASGGTNQPDPGRDFVRYDENDYPYVYNIDHQNAIQDLTLHPQYHQILNMANLEDSESLRIELRKHVFFIGPQKLWHHHCKEIPEAIKNAKPQSKRFSVETEENMIIFQVLANLKFLDDFAVALKDNASSEQSLKQFFEKWQQDIEWNSAENYSLMNQGVILTSLYGTIVYPKEKFFDNIPETPLKDLNHKRWGAITFLIPQPPPDTMSLRSFVRRLRNALSHSRVTVKKDPEHDMIFSFEDGPQVNNHWTTDFSVSFGVHHLHNFIYSLNKGLITGEWD